jgi:ABC-type glucose/galactose transport system permease subunit
VKTFKSTNREIIYSFKAPDIAWIIENKKEFGKTIFHTYEEVEQILKTGR